MAATETYRSSSITPTPGDKGGEMVKGEGGCGEIG